MAEKFLFDVKESLETIEKILNIAEKYLNNESFSGQLAKRLIELKFEILDENFIELLNNKLITCRNFNGLELKRAFDGGVRGFSEVDNVNRLHRLSIFLIIYQRELCFRGNYSIDQGHIFYFLDQLVRNNRGEFLKESSWCLELLDDMPTYIMQEEFHSENAIALSRVIRSTDISKVENFIKTREESISKIDQWQADFISKEMAVNNLKDKLDTYKTGFNFVGLYSGFSQLNGSKDKELLYSNIQYYFLIIMMITIPVVEFFYLLNNFTGDVKDINKLIALAIPSISLIFILIWLFRIMLVNIRLLS